MKKMTRNIIICSSVIIIIILLILFTDLMSLLKFFYLSFSPTCEEKCLNKGFSSYHCMQFPGIYLSTINPCGNDGINIGQTSDCRSIDSRLMVGAGPEQCCCYLQTE